MTMFRAKRVRSRARKTMQWSAWVSVLALCACGTADGPAQGMDEGGDDAVSVDEAVQMSALAVGEDGSDEQVADATDDAPDAERDCSLAGVRVRLVARYDADADGQLSAAELEALRADYGDARFPRHHVARAFRRRLIKRIYDASGDGKLDRAERAELEGDLEQRCEQRKALLLSKHDANGNGELDDGEFQAFVRDLAVRFQARRAELLARFDANGDGNLGPAERFEARSALRDRLEARWQERVAEFDADGDGELDADELSALREELKARVRGDYLH